MFRFSVRRLTAAVALLAILGLALPATAAPVRPHAAKAPVVSLFDRLLSWAGSFLPGQSQPQTKGILPPATSTSKTPPSTADATNGMDPNG
jgi:hypothetical protein